jgi:hypothetical protein
MKMLLALLIIIGLIMGYFLFIAKTEVVAPETPIKDFQGPTGAPSTQGPASLPGAPSASVANPE